MYCSHTTDQHSLQNIRFSDEEMIDFLQSHGYEFKIQKYKYCRNEHRYDDEIIEAELLRPIKDGKDLFPDRQQFHWMTDKHDLVRSVFFEELKGALLRTFSGLGE